MKNNPKINDISQSINIVNNFPLPTGRQRTIVHYNKVNVLIQSDMDIVCFMYIYIYMCVCVSIPQYYTIVNSLIFNATRHAVYQVEYVNEGKVSKRLSNLSLEICVI